MKKYSILFCFLFCLKAFGQTKEYNDYGNVIWTKWDSVNFPKTIYDFVPDFPEHDSITYKIDLAEKGGRMLFNSTSDNFPPNWQPNLYWKMRAIFFIYEIRYYVNGEWRNYPTQAFEFDEQLQIRMKHPSKPR